MFFRPAGSSVQQLGIIPDIILPSLTEEMRAGEIYLDNHLPWDQIPGVRLNIFDRNLDRKIAQLREQSAARIAENAAYQAFIRQIALYRTIRDRRTITLNEEARYEIYRREREIAREAERFTDVVVLPTPPFWLATAIILANVGSFARDLFFS